MKATINIIETPSPTRISTRYAFKSILIIALVCSNAMSTIQAQEVRYTNRLGGLG